MIKRVHRRILAFDLEWVPDALAGRLLYDVPESAGEEEVLRVMWERGGATEAEPMPYLKTALCRIVSIAWVRRYEKSPGEVSVDLVSLPSDPDDPEEASERRVVERFLEGLGKNEPQLIGFNSVDADLRILVQRGVILGVRAERFAARPNKPWEGRDYFARESEWNIDLKKLLGGFGKATPALNEIAVQAGIPGKFDVDGTQVAALWLAGDLRRIVQYNEFDALSTYLLFLRVAHFCGHFDGEQYVAEQRRVRDLLDRESSRPGRAHLEVYLREWDRVRAAVAAGRP